MRVRWVVAAVGLVVVFASGSWAGWMPTVADILEHPERFVNQGVTVTGMVVDQHMVSDPYQPWLKGEFTVQDQTGKQLLVRSCKEPPPIGKVVTVRGKVMQYGTSYAIEQRSILPENALLWVGLGVLVILAIVLVVLLVRAPAQPRTDVVAQPGWEPETTPAPPEPVRYCEQCGAPNPADARHCEQCGRPMGVTVPDEGTTTQVSGTSAQPAGEKPTIVVGPEEPQPIADLYVIEGVDDRPGTRFALRKGRQKIGRREDMEIRLHDEAVSREHALIWWEDGRFVIQDLASTGGTLVNGERITRVPLVDGDTIQMGRTRLVFRMIPVSGE